MKIDLRRNRRSLARGFVLLRCDQCLSIQGYFLKQLSDSCACRICGNDIELDKDKMVLAHCVCPKCGDRISWRTNLTQRRFDWMCNKCGHPVAMVLLSGGIAYVSEAE